MVLHFLSQVLSMLDGNLYTEINPLFSELLLARVFYYSKRMEQNHLQTVLLPYLSCKAWPVSQDFGETLTLSIMALLCLCFGLQGVVGKAFASSSYP